MRIEQARKAEGRCTLDTRQGESKATGEFTKMMVSAPSGQTTIKARSIRTSRIIRHVDRHKFHNRQNKCCRHRPRTDHSGAVSQ